MTATTEGEARLIVAYLRHMADLRKPSPEAVHEVLVLASDIEAGFHLDPALNPAAGEPHPPLVLERTDTHEATRGDAFPLGCIDIDTPRGTVHCHDAPGIMTTEVCRRGQFERAGLLVYDPEPQTRGGKGMALLAQLDADGARSFAASLLRMATKLDQVHGRKPN